MSHGLENVTRQVLASLLQMRDPYIKHKHKQFKEMSVQDEGLSFVQRMEADLEVRDKVMKLIGDEILVEELVDEAKEQH